MSYQSDLFQYFPNENPDAKYEDLFQAFFAPPPQPADAPSPESFDQDVGQDVAELDLDWSLDDFLSTVCDNVPAASTLPTLTYATDTGSSYEIASSKDFDDNVPSVLLFPSETKTCGSVIDGPYTTYDTICPAVLSGGLPLFPSANPVKAQSDYGATCISTSIPVHAPNSEVQIKAQSDYGTSDVSTYIPVHVPDYEAAQIKAQPDYKIPGVSTSPPVHVPESEAVRKAKDKRFKCTEPECPFSMSEPMKFPKWLTLLASLCA